MQKRWKTILTLVLALMMLAVAVGAEETVPAQTQQPEAEAQVTVVPALEAAPEETLPAAEEPTVVPALPAQSAEPTAVPTAEAAEDPMEAPTTEPTVAPTEAPTAEPTPEPTPAPTAVPYLADMPESRGVWVATNADMKDHQTDEMAEAALLSAKMLLARGVADGAPIGVSLMEKKDVVSRTRITTPEAWNDLMTMLESSSFTSKKGSGEQFRTLLQWLNEKARSGEMGEADVWVLCAQPQGNLGSEGKQASEEFSANSAVAMNFLSFQRRDETLQKNSKWILEEISSRGMANFQGDVFYYEDFLRDPLPMAMEIFGLNMQAYPILQDHQQPNGDFHWVHEGLDTLLLVEANGPVAVSEVELTGLVQAFPIVIELNEKQSMVLLRNAAPGTYCITGGVTNVKAAYHIEDAALTLTGDDAEGAPIPLFLEDHDFRVHFSVTQIEAEDVHFQVLINGEEYALFQGEETRLDRIRVEGEGVYLTVHVDAAQMPLGEGTLQFVARVGDFRVESPVYPYAVTDRPLTLNGDGRAEVAYYANVPGQENQPVQLDLAQYVLNLDAQELTYLPDSDAYTLEGGLLTYVMGEALQASAWQIQVSDGVSDPQTVQVDLYPVDFMAQVNSWTALQLQTAYEGKLGQPMDITFTLPAGAAELYAKVCSQYPELPASLAEALRIEAVMTESKICPDGVVYPAVLTLQEDGSLLGAVQVAAFEERAEAAVTFRAAMLEAPLTGQLLADCTIVVKNDEPKLVAGVIGEATAMAEIQGAPDKREPLALSAVLLAEGQPLLSGELVPAALFVDRINREGLTVTITAEPAALVTLQEKASGNTVTPAEEGKWVLNPALSSAAYDLFILDKGTVKLAISASDGEMDSVENIAWTIEVTSPYDRTMMIAAIAAAAAAVLLILLLILRQVRKPSFARMNSHVHMRVQTNYSVGMVYSTAPMHVYGKKETDLARLFIACQQPPVTSLPLDVLSDVTVQPRKNGYRLVVGKRAEHLNVVVDNAAQETRRPVNFQAGKTVCLYKDTSEGLIFVIDQNESPNNRVDF